MRIASAQVLRRLVLQTAFVLASITSAATAWTAEAAPESIWLISTRETACCDANAEPQYWRLGADHQWAPADQKAFLASDDPAVATIIFIHGNRTDRETAVQDGWSVHQFLSQQAPGKAYRFVIWSWPSDRIQAHTRVDAQVKAARSEHDSFLLAQAIRPIQPAVPVSLIGYSFGARMIGGALQLLAGGAFEGRTLEPPAQSRTQVRAVLIAAGMDDTALLPWGPNGLALTQTQRVLITCNLADPALRWYRRLYGRGGPDALGFVGPACPSQLGPEQQKLEVINVSGQVGRNHAWDCYLWAPSLRARLAEYAFLNPPSAEAVAEKTGVKMVSQEQADEEE